MPLTTLNKFKLPKIDVKTVFLKTDDAQHDISSVYTLNVMKHQPYGYY